MESKLISLTFFIFIFISCKSQNTSIYSNQEIIQDIENSKKYALCSCLKSQGFIYSDSLIKDHSTNVYLEKGLNHIDYYRELSSYTKEKVKEIEYKSFKGNGITLKMAECIDFYTSKELNEFILSIQNKNYNK